MVLEAMRLVYIDDSRDEQICVFSALIIPAERWRECFELVRTFRRGLKTSDGVFVRKELHAWKLVSGRGRISDRVVTKYRRCQIFKEALTLVAALPDVHLANACSTANDDERVFEWLANRINRTMRAWQSHAMLICDQGKEAAYTRLLRRMGVFNPIPSMLGGWPEGTATRNIPVELILEDPSSKTRNARTSSSSPTFARTRCSERSARSHRRRGTGWIPPSIALIRSSYGKRHNTTRRGSFDPLRGEPGEEAGPTLTSEGEIGPALIAVVRRSDTCAGPERGPQDDPMDYPAHAPARARIGHRTLRVYDPEPGASREAAEADEVRPPVARLPRGTPRTGREFHVVGPGARSRRPGVHPVDRAASRRHGDGAASRCRRRRRRRDRHLSSVREAGHPVRPLRGGDRGGEATAQAARPTARRAQEAPDPEEHVLPTPTLVEEAPLAESPHRPQEGGHRLARDAGGVHRRRPLPARLRDS